MSQHPKVSIIMAAYNCEAYVAEAIDSILAQSHQDWEFLIADDGSTDATRTIIDTYVDSRIQRFHNKENQGLVYTWNNLIKHARGEFLLWQDADDISYPKRIETLLTEFHVQSDLMMCGSNIVRPLLCGRRQIISNLPSSYEAIKQQFAQKQAAFLGSTRMLRRTALTAVEGFRPFFNRIGGEDLDFVLRLSERHRISNILEPLYVYRYNPYSNSRGFNHDSFLKLFNQEIAFFLADQRRKDRGLDGLMPNGNKQELDAFITSLKLCFEADLSLIYRRSAMNQIANKDFGRVLNNIISAIIVKPRKLENYQLILRFIRSVIGSIYRV